MAVRLALLVLVSWTVFTAKHAPGTSGRGLVILVLFVVCVACTLVWITQIDRLSGITPDQYVLALAGAALTGTSPSSAASAFAFFAVVTAGFRADLRGAVPIALLAALALAVSSLIYDNDAVSVLAYSLGFAVALLAASNAHQARLRAEQAELLLAQSQRSHEEQLRATRLEESTRIAREIHDVLAHALAGLTIQLEATRALVEQGADHATVLARVERAHELAREGLRETRRAVGALRDGSVAGPARAGIEALVSEYGAETGAVARVTVEGDGDRLSGQIGEAAFRVVQEALTNVRKHAPGAEVSVSVDAPTGADLVVVVDDRAEAGAPVPASSNGLAASGGGFGLRGMRERAEALGGTLTAAASEDGWRVELRLPPATPGEPS
jgi:signal transduction histidine kinase